MSLDEEANRIATVEEAVHEGGPDEGDAAGDAHRAPLDPASSVAVPAPPDADRTSFPRAPSSAATQDRLSQRLRLRHRTLTPPHRPHPLLSSHLKMGSVAN